MFITASFKNANNKAEIEYLCPLVRDAGLKDFCFVRDIENYEHVFDNPTELMNRALKEISKSEYLLIDLTEKPTGRAIEAGMAFALGKKILVIMKKETKIKDSTKGIATAVIEYDNIEEISNLLKDFA